MEACVECAALAGRKIAHGYDEEEGLTTFNSPDEYVSEHEGYFDVADSVKAAFNRLEAARE